jgi:hypothetical protein
MSEEEDIQDELPSYKKVTPQDLLKVENPFVQFGLGMWLAGETTFEEALSWCVVAMAQENENLRALWTEYPDPEKE